MIGWLKNWWQRPQWRDRCRLLERIVIPALQDDKKVAVEALKGIEALWAEPHSARAAGEALNHLEVDRPHLVVGWHTAEGVSTHFENPHFMGCRDCTPHYQRVHGNLVRFEEALGEGYVCDTCHRPLIGGEPREIPD